MISMSDDAHDHSMSFRFMYTSDVFMSDVSDIFMFRVHVGCLCDAYTCRMSLRCVYMSDVFMIAVDQCLDIISCMGWMFFHFNVLFNDDFRIRDNDH